LADSKCSCDDITNRLIQVDAVPLSVVTLKYSRLPTCTQRSDPAAVRGSISGRQHEYLLYALVGIEQIRRLRNMATCNHSNSRNRSSSHRQASRAYQVSIVIGAPSARVLTYIRHGGAARRYHIDSMSCGSKVESRLFMSLSSPHIQQTTSLSSCIFQSQNRQ
jgi:hypothetical protein